MDNRTFSIKRLKKKQKISLWDWSAYDGDEPMFICLGQRSTVHHRLKQKHQQEADLLLYMEQAFVEGQD